MDCIPLSCVERPSKCSLEEGATIRARTIRLQAERDCAKMTPGLRRALTSTVSFLGIDELVHACNVLPFLRDEIFVLNLSHFAGKCGEFVVSLLEDLEIVGRLTRLTFEPSPAAMRYGRSHAYLYKSWPIPSSLPLCSWESLTTLHLHVTWALKVIDAVMDSPMVALESLEITLPARNAILLNYAHCFPVLHSLKVQRAYPDDTNLYSYLWSDFSQLPATLTLLDAAWARVIDLPPGLLAARVCRFDQSSEIFEFPSSLTHLTVADASGEIWAEGYSRLASDHVRVTLEDAAWDRRMSFPSISDFLPANVERLVGASDLDDINDVITPSDAVVSAQPHALFTSVKRTSVQIEKHDYSIVALDALVVHAGRRTVHVMSPPVGSALESVAIWSRKLDGLIVVDLVGAWCEAILEQTLVNLPVTVSHVYVSRFVSSRLGTRVLFKYLPRTVTILSLRIFYKVHLSELVENLPQTVQHLVLQDNRGVEVDYGHNCRTAPLTVWLGNLPAYMYDGHGGIQRVVTQ